MITDFEIVKLIQGGAFNFKTTAVFLIPKFDQRMIASPYHDDNHMHIRGKTGILKNKAGYTATLVACGWTGAVLEKVTRASGQEPYAQKAQKRRKSKKGTDQPTDRPTDRPTNPPT